jgi:hypothetical protein
VAKLRGTKLRAVTRSGKEPAELPSRARPHKPPAKAISARKAAGMKIGGGKTPPKLRKQLDKEPLPKRTHPADPREKEQVGSKRYGTREPKAGRRNEAAETRDARPSRRANTPAADPGTRRDKKARGASTR